MSAYASDLYLHGLEFNGDGNQPNYFADSRSTNDPQLGMIDSGATASAAAEAVVKGLISAVLTQDRAAKIEFDQSAQPYFRFGMGEQPCLWRAPYLFPVHTPQSRQVLQAWIRQVILGSCVGWHGLSWKGRPWDYDRLCIGACHEYQ